MGELRGVAATALGVARIRAAESARPDRLFDDPYAAAFVAAAPPPPAADTRAADAEVPAAHREAFYRGLFRHIVLRTRFFDDYLTAAATEHALRQVVVPAAGLDTRAYRLPWPDGVRLYEVDLPEVLAFKERVLAEQGARPRCARTAVAADLRTDWSAALRSAGFAPDRPTAWLVEGLLVYLSAAEAARLLTTIGEQSAPGSRLAFPGSRDFRNSPMMAGGRALPSMRAVSALWQGGLDEPADDWLGRHGWRPRTYARETVAASYGRALGEGAGKAGGGGAGAGQADEGAFVVAVRGDREAPAS
ncbi:SAM-dependent methyltransferase [Streptomyces sp. NRRL S-1448]|uniref:SAM-dependent methyltransferase n=1 Tax=Streptomyces sp. NRRL S-1448 TaxID=1463883 RepID=UPI0007C5BECE|nr:SAM-dependent methyltransferase [Streptomyces sp. NRRL S-1448]